MEKEELVKMLQDIIRLVEAGGSDDEKLKEELKEKEDRITELEDKLDTIEEEISDAVSTLEGIDCSK